MRTTLFTSTSEATCIHKIGKAPSCQLNCQCFHKVFNTTWETLRFSTALGIYGVYLRSISSGGDLPACFMMQAGRPPTA